MEKNQETVNVWDFLKRKWEEVSKPAIFIKCAMDGLTACGRCDLQIDPSCFSYQLCPDQYVGQIKESEDWNEFTRKSVFNDEWEVINIPKGEKIMIMILESPHKDEFKGEIGPESHISILKLAYEIDPEIPFLVQHPSATLAEIIHSFPIAELSKSLKPRKNVILLNRVS